MMTQKNRKLKNKTILFRRKRLRTDGKENMMVRDGIKNQDEEREREREE